MSVRSADISSRYDPVAPSHPSSPSGVGTLFAPEMRSREFGICFAALMVLVFVLNAAPVPFGNELIYLLAPYKQWHPEFLQNDWTFGTPRSEHFVFNWVVGFVMLAVSPEVIGWLGRLVTWALLAAGLMRLGMQFGISPSASAFAIALWLLIDQSIVAVSSMIGTFEAQSVAYVLLVYSLLRFLDERDTSGAIMLGLCFTFHPAVGLIAGPPLFLALLTEGRSWRRLTITAGWTILCGLPGLVPLLIGVDGAAGASRAEWEYLVRNRFPMHLDPMAWVRRDVLLLGTISVFHFMHWWQFRQVAAIRFLGWFLMGSGAFFTFGLLARLMGWFELLQSTPFRVFATVAPLFFLFAVVHAYGERERLRWRHAMTIIGTLALMGLTNPVGYLWDRTIWRAREWRGADDIRRTFTWLAQRAPSDAVAILPPWRRDSFYYARRPQVANFDQVRLDRIPEWRERIEALVGPLSDDPASFMADALEERYTRLTTEQISAIAARYDARYLVSQAAHPYPVRYESGRYRVYELTDIANQPRAADSAFGGGMAIVRGSAR